MDGDSASVDREQRVGGREQRAEEGPVDPLRPGEGDGPRPEAASPHEADSLVTSDVSREST